MPRRSSGRSTASVRSTKPVPAPTRSASTIARAPAPTSAARPPAARPQASAPPASTASRAAPPAAAGAHAPAPQQPGMLSQIAATAGGVAVGHVVGSGISHAMFGGHGGQQAESAPAPAPAPAGGEQPSYMGSNSYYNQDQGSYAASGDAGVCSTESREFYECLTNTNGNMEACKYFLQRFNECKGIQQ